MEQKINITKYMIDAVKEVEKALETCQKSKIESHMERLHLIGQLQRELSQDAIVVNNLENCNSNEVLQDMLDNWEGELHRMHDVIQVMKPTYWE